MRAITFGKPMTEKYRNWDRLLQVYPTETDLPGVKKIWDLIAMQDRVKLRKVCAYLAAGSLLAAAWPVASQNLDSVINEPDPLENRAETQKQSL